MKCPVELGTSLLPFSLQHFLMYLKIRNNIILGCLRSTLKQTPKALLRHSVFKSLLLFSLFTFGL